MIQKNTTKNQNLKKQKRLEWAAGLKRFVLLVQVGLKIDFRKIDTMLQFFLRILNV